MTITEANTERTRRPLTKAEADTLRHSLDSLAASASDPITKALLQRDRAAILCMLDAGLRAGEVTALNVFDFRTTTRGAIHSLLVPNKGKPIAKAIFLGSSLSNAIHTYVSEARPTLAPGRNPQDMDPLFISRRGNRLSVSVLRKSFDLICMSSSLERLYVHSLRQSFSCAVREHFSYMYGGTQNTSHYATDYGPYKSVFDSLPENFFQKNNRPTDKDGIQ